MGQLKDLLYTLYIRPLRTHSSNSKGCDIDADVAVCHCQSPANNITSNRNTLANKAHYSSAPSYCDCIQTCSLNSLVPLTHKLGWHNEPFCSFCLLAYTANMVVPRDPAISEHLLKKRLIIVNFSSLIVVFKARDASVVKAPPVKSNMSPFKSSNYWCEWLTLVLSIGSACPSVAKQTLDITLQVPDILLPGDCFLPLKMTVWTRPNMELTSNQSNQISATERWQRSTHMTTFSHSGCDHFSTRRWGSIICNT